MTSDTATSPESLVFSAQGAQVLPDDDGLLGDQATVLAALAHGRPAEAAGADQTN